MAKKQRPGFDGDEWRLSLIAAVPTVLIFAVGVGLVLLSVMTLRTLGVLAATFFLLGLFLFVIGWHTRLNLRTRFARNRVRLLWLRPFRMEGRGAFRTSRVIDRLPRHGILPLTLQDGDMRLSLEQLRYRRMGRFCSMVGLQIVAIAWGLSAIWPEQGHWFEAVFIGVLFVAAPFVLLATWIGAGVLIMLLEAVTRLFPSLWRDDFKRLAPILEKLRRGRTEGGAVVLRIKDANWREAVIRSLAVSDVVLIDVTKLTENVLWELRQLDLVQPPPKLVLMCRADQQADESALRARVEGVLRLRFGPIVFYPARRGRGAEFERRLVQAIHDAAAEKGSEPEAE